MPSTPVLSVSIKRTRRPAATAALIRARESVKQKTGRGVHSASCWGCEARCTRHLTLSRAHDAVPRWRATFDMGHCPRRRKRDASRTGRVPSGTTRDARSTGHLALARSRAAGRAKRRPKGAMRGAGNEGYAALSALRAAFAKGCQISPRCRFSILSTSLWCLLRLCWEKAGLCEVGKK